MGIFGWCGAAAAGFPVYLRSRPFRDAVVAGRGRGGGGGGGGNQIDIIAALNWHNPETHTRARQRYAARIERNRYPGIGAGILAIINHTRTHSRTNLLPPLQR